VYCCFIE
jgi:hypothetical protein